MSEMPPRRGKEVSKKKTRANPPAQSCSPSSRRLREVTPVRRRSSAAQRLAPLTTELSATRQTARTTCYKVNLPPAMRETEIGESLESMKSPKPEEKAGVTTLDGDLNDSFSSDAAGMDGRNAQTDLETGKQ